MGNPVTLTPARIEALAEARMDTIDRQLMTGRIDQAEYEAHAADLSAWVKTEYDFLKLEKGA